MSDSTTQQQKKGKAGAGSEKVKIEDNPDEKHPFERDLYKKIRNNEKKLKDIKELEEKVKGNPDFNANEEQKKKIARRETLERELVEMNRYVDMFRTCMKEDEKNKKDQQVRHQKEVSLAKKQTIRAITNLITLHTLKECGQEIPQEIDEALDAFSLSFDTILNKDQSQFRWRASRDGFVDALSMLAATSKDKLEGMDISPDELNDQIAGLITSGTYPETIESKVLPSGATHHEEAKQSAAAHEAQQEVAHEDEPNAEAAAQEEDNQQDEYDEEAQQEGPHGASAAHGDQAQERDPAIVEQTGEPEEHKGEEAPAEQNPEAENNQAERRGGRGNRHGGGNGRGNRGRGDEVNRGERGGDRGERRGRRGDRGRPNTGKRNDEDVEGFRIVEGQDGKNRGGRGRGGRGRGGYYNNNTYRGGRGGRGERGARGGPNQENGGFIKRGDRGQRGRGGRGGRGGEGGDEQPPAEQPAAEQKQAAENNAPADNE